jgi:hypothetical protein
MNTATPVTRSGALPSFPVGLPGLWLPDRMECNMGGPRSRRRRERLESSLLGERQGVIRCPRVLRLGLEFQGVDPVSRMERLLAERGLTDPEELRSLFSIPSGCRVCRPDAHLPRLDVVPGSPSAERDEALRQGLLLGLCTAVLYDPARPVLWTTASLTRAVELYEIEGFYA